MISFFSNERDVDEKWKSSMQRTSHQNINILIKGNRNGILLNAKLNKKKNKENSQNKRKSLIKVNE